MLTNAQLESMRATQDLALPDLCDILRPTKVVNSIGSVSSTGETAVVADISCRVFAAQMMTAIGQQSRPLEVNRFLIRMPLGTDVRDRDFIEITTKDDFRLRVERVIEPQSWDTLLTVECEVIT